MNDLLRQLESPYDTISRSLSELRELFYRKGRIADANAKLDETVKLMAIQYAKASGSLPSDLSNELANQETFSLDAVNRSLRAIADVPPFGDSEGRSIFGSTPATAFDDGDEDLAFELYQTAGLAIEAQLAATDPLDIVNEAFGHHVRDNFRSNTEDAQYMTPPEVVEFMVELAERELLKSASSDERSDRLVVSDPSCGVGSFLVSWHRVHEFASQRNKEIPKPLIIGQDKVDRMARLAKANLIFSGFEADQIFVGSSIEDGTPISNFDNSVDLILTNPPFGARFDTQELQKSSRKSLPTLCAGIGSSKVADSEFLFIERYLTLLRTGGVCIVVVPDSVISAKGAAAAVRQLISRSAELIAVVELPPVTFAQAGTRTKTSVLAFRKTDNPSREQKVFFAEVNDLGFEVSKRKGVALKRAQGSNELPNILRAYETEEDLALPSGSFAAWREITPSAIAAWTPRRFRIAEATDVGLPPQISFESRPLDELVKPREKRKSQAYSDGTLFISVLHVIGEGMLDVPSMSSYAPVTPGLQVKPGNVIISRINPRIPRVLVVPDLGVPLLCSSEFEILVPADGISPYALAFLLLSQPVQDQICSLTAGTSASHSRVRPDEIRQIALPWPKDEAAFETFIAKYQKANEAIISGTRQIMALRSGAVTH
ncbi:MAG: N-6 DNA methylase [Pseudomonadota bacterium]